MAIRTVNVQTESKLVPGTTPNGFREGDVSIINTGTVTAYVDNEQQRDSTTGYPLTAGSTLVWQAGQELWTVAPSPTTLVLHPNAGDNFNAGGVAQQILSQGLAPQIASAINVLGVPAIESATILYQASMVTPANTNPGFGGAPLDCSRYQSLRMYFSETYSIGVILPPRPYRITWYADAAGLIPVGFDSFNVPTGTNGGSVPVASAVVAVPCRGPFFNLVAQSVNGASTATAVVIGSYRPVQDLKWTKLTDGFTGSSGLVVSSAWGDQGGTFSISSNLAVGSYVDYPILPGGDATVSITVGAVTAQCEFNLKDTNSNRYVYRRLVQTSANSQTFLERVTLPNSPVSANVTIAGSTVNTNYSIIGVDRA